jgi:hypothetical protein
MESETTARCLSKKPLALFFGCGSIPTVRNRQQTNPYYDSDATVDCPLTLTRHYTAPNNVDPL